MYYCNKHMGAKEQEFSVLLWNLDHVGLKSRFGDFKLYVSERKGAGGRCTGQHLKREVICTECAP